LRGKGNKNLRFTIYDLRFFFNFYKQFVSSFRLKGKVPWQAKRDFSLPLEMTDCFNKKNTAHFYKCTAFFLSIIIVNLHPLSQSLHVYFVLYIQACRLRDRLVLFCLVLRMLSVLGQFREK